MNVEALRGDVDVALVIDSTMPQDHLDVARQIATRLLESPVRLALVSFADHSECPGNGVQAALPFDVDVSHFAEPARNHARFVERRLVHVPHEYSDAALECGLKKAADLDWRDHAHKFLGIIGDALPHDSSTSGIPLRTGVTCPDNICWKTQLHRIADRGIETRAACGALGVVAPGNFWLGLRRRVWMDLNGGRAPYVIDQDLVEEWSGHHGP